MKVPLISNLKRLQLPGLASTHEVRLQEATGNQLNHLEFLEPIVNDELAIRSCELPSLDFASNLQIWI